MPSWFDNETGDGPFHIVVIETEHDKGIVFNSSVNTEQLDWVLFHYDMFNAGHDPDWSSWSSGVFEWKSYLTDNDMMFSSKCRHLRMPHDQDQIFEIYQEVYSPSERFLAYTLNRSTELIPYHHALVLNEHIYQFYKERLLYDQDFSSLFESQDNDTDKFPLPLSSVLTPTATKSFPLSNLATKSTSGSHVWSVFLNEIQEWTGASIRVLAPLRLINRTSSVKIRFDNLSWYPLIFEQEQHLLCYIRQSCGGIERCWSPSLLVKTIENQWFKAFQLLREISDRYNQWKVPALFVIALREIGDGSEDSMKMLDMLQEDNVAVDDKVLIADQIQQWPVHMNRLKIVMERLGCSPVPRKVLVHAWRYGAQISKGSKNLKHHVKWISDLENYLFERGCTYSEIDLHDAAVNGNCLYVEWLLDHRCPLNAHSILDLCQRMEDISELKNHKHEDARLYYASHSKTLALLKSYLSYEQRERVKRLEIECRKYAKRPCFNFEQYQDVSCSLTCYRPFSDLYYVDY
eukprot:GILJ01028369.1.p1 GENE.GILJ01028369.1~~GILJ01028369.1.p1  ORF type:complete len:517 (-),score=30.61 GILJ01028369.1:139-1689(-)